MSETLFEPEDLSAMELLNTTNNEGANPTPSNATEPEQVVTINGQEFSTACIAYLQSILGPDELPSAIIHCSTAAENDASDKWGLQGGQFWTEPTPNPTKKPSTNAPTASPSVLPSVQPSFIPTLSLQPSKAAGEPTYHPTLHDKLFVLRGTIYYDRNANGKRDANIETEEYGPDTEYNIGLGGVNLRLVECDLNTNEAVRDQIQGGNNATEGSKEGWNSYSTTISQGYDVLFHPVLADRSVDGGKYNMINIKVNRAYYIEAEAPVGFLFTGGVCNNAVPGWKCPKPTRESFAAVGEASMKNLREDRESYGEKFVNGGEDALGLRTGRSVRCVSVDRTGRVDGNLDLGVMRTGDVKLDKTEVRMTLDLADVETSGVEIVGDTLNAEGEHEKGNSDRSLLVALKSIPEAIQDRILHHAGHLGNGRYLLNEDDRYSIGVVAAEVLASSLDVSLAAKNIQLDHISPKDVMLSLAAGTDSAPFNEGLRKLSNSTRPTNTQAYNSRNPAPRRQNRLTIDLEVWGHYPPALNVDFDYVVQDSINRETETIREELIGYNSNCDDQLEKVDNHGFVLDDFEEIHSNKGVVANTRMKRERNAAAEALDAVDVLEEETSGGVFRTACSNEIKLPDYFEKSLETIKATKVEAVTILEEPSEIPWMIIGLFAGLMVVMLVGAFFVFRLGFKKSKKEENEDYSYEDEDSRYDDDTEYGSRSKATISVSTKPRDYSDRKYDEKMESYRSGVPSDAPTPIPARPAKLISRELNNIGAAVAQVGGGFASRFKFGNRQMDKSRTSKVMHEGDARGKSSSRPVEKTLDDSESIVDPTKVLDDDHIKAEDRLKDFERRMKSMKASTFQNQPIDDYDQSTMSSRPELPVDIKFAAKMESKNSGSTGKGSSDDSSSSSSSSSSSDSSAPVNKRKKKAANKKKRSNVVKSKKISGRMS